VVICFPVLVCCTEKNLASLHRIEAVAGAVELGHSKASYQFLESKKVEDFFWSVFAKPRRRRRFHSASKDVSPSNALKLSKTFSTNDG
jgi:hypothetical protein